MSRSVKDSDDDFEPKPSVGRMQTRMLTIQSANSPLRRSSRIKQNKYSPGSESDSSISSIQTTRSARPRTTTMDSTASDTTKKLRTRKHSISSEISEIDIDIPRTPVKRTTRQSLGATSLINTPTRVNTRATSKRFMRAGSETKSPLPATRTTRRTRARSIDPESLTENKNQSSSPTKTRRRASVLPSSSQIKEQTEPNDHIPYVRLDSTIVETDEITNSGNSDSSPDKHLHQIKRKLQNVVKDKVEEDDSEYENVKTSTDSSKSDETLQLSEKKDATQTEDITRETAKDTENTLDKEQKKFEETPSSDKSTIEEFSTYSSPNHQNSTKKDTKIENLSDIENSLLDICGSNKEMEVMPENLSGTSIEEEKSNKENQMLNVISDVAEKLVQPKSASSIKPFTSPFMDKLLTEKETIKKDVNLNKRIRSRESTEVAIKYSDLSKETIDNSQEKMDISIKSINSSASDKIILLHESTEVVDKVANKDEISTENISAYKEDATEIISELGKTDTKECTTTDNKNFNKSESDEVDKTSRLSINLDKSKQTSDSRESLASMDENEIKLALEEQNPHCNDNEVSLNVAHSKPDQSVDLQISSPINKTSNNSATVTDKVLTQVKIIVTDSSDSTEEENLLKEETEETTSLSSNVVLETNNSTSNDSNDTIIQDNQFTDVIEASKKSAMDISFEKTDSKDVLSEKVKPNLKRKSTDNLEGEKQSLQMERTQKDQENINVVDDVSDVNDGISLFQDIPADKWKEKNDVKTGSVQSTSQLVEEEEKENESEHDLILVDKQAWLAAETIKAVKEAEAFEYDSDDTVLLKSRLDSLASQANYNIEQLATVDEELTLDIDSNEKNEKQVKKRKSRTKKRLVSEIDEDISRYTEDENLIPVDKSLNDSKTALNRTNDRSISRLNKSGQSEKTKRRSSKASNELEKEIEDDSNELNRSSLTSRNNISLRKSTGKRTSLNKSSKDVSMQNISPNKSQTDNSEKELDTAARTRKKLYKKKRSLEQSCNEDIDDNATESEKKNVATENCKKHENTSLNHSTGQESEPMDTGKIMHLNESDDSDIDVSVIAMDLASKTSMIANMGSDSDESNQVPFREYLFRKANSESSSTDDSNGYSDSLNREYNLDGLERKFSDDDVAADECRDSEVEFSDSDDNGSDLEDFIVDDNEVENDEEDNDIEAENDDEEDNEDDDNAVQKEKVEDEKEKANFNTKLINLESENEDNEDVQKKDIADKDTNQNKFIKMEDVSLYANTSHKLSKTHKNNNKSIEHISPCRSETETKQNKKMKSNMKKNEKPILQDLSNSNLSSKKKKKKSFVKENETASFEMCHLASSSLQNMLTPQHSQTETERNLSEQLNKCKSAFAKLSELHALMEFSTSDLNSCKKLELDETFERIPENKANKSNNTIKTTQNISVKDESKDLILNKDSPKKFEDASKEKISDDLLPDLLKKIRGLTNPLKSLKTSSRKTMNIDIETPRLKYLRKEKLNESAPTKLEYSTETNSLQEQLSAEKDITQIRIKEKNKDKIYDLIIPSNDDVIQKCSQKKQKKRKRQDSSNKNMSDKVLSEDVTELNVPKKKIKLTPLTNVEDIHKDICETNKKKNKKDKLKENITDQAKNAIELNVPKKKIKLTPLTNVEDIHKDTCETNKKKNKKDKLKENITDKAKNAIELNVSKKKKPVKLTQLSTVEDNTLKDVSLSHSDERKLKQLMRSITREVWSQDITKLKKYKLTQLPVVEDNIRENICQINERKKKKEKQDTSKNVIDKPSSTDIEIKIPKKKKRAKFTQLPIVEDAHEEACQINKIKKKKKQINTVEENTNVNKDNMLRDIRGNKTELPQYKKKNKVVNSLELDLLTDKQEQQVKKKIKRQETVENIETKKKKKKKKEEEDTLSIQIPAPKKSEKILSSKLRLQKTTLGMSESKNVAYNTKKLDETDAKLYTEESRSKKKRNRSEDIENAICMNIPTKSKKEIKERKCLLPSSSLKRLPDDVIENLADVPTKSKKRQKTLRDKEKIVSSTTTGKVKVTTTDCDNTLNTSGCTTQFRVVNLQKTKKQSLKGAAAATSFRERMLARNNREPISSYLMFCEKMSNSK
ncbi:PREDICTED: kinesin-related protein 4-like isoform X2 [Trachymyrmex septentrionalis]|uniref:kinesin-related protein 4-like isoform X2 n=1 Tax=Trachymyrmex septentrionalis TaxID=34720 RepID=UPI00084EECDC|nr:PREDICTED: kinesin-related protein 4-like isoform X2 [Trachymyrmex septentrionalis]